MSLPREISDALDAGCNDAHRLKALLEEEFEALRGQSLDAFEKLQPLKTEIFATLAPVSYTHLRAHETLRLGRIGGNGRGRGYTDA